MLDQHVLLDGKPHLLGTGVAAELRAAGFVGVTCIVSGAEYTSTSTPLPAPVPAVDVISPKSFQPAMLASILLEFHRSRLRFGSGARAQQTSDGGGGGGGGGVGGGGGASVMAGWPGGGGGSLILTRASAGAGASTDAGADAGAAAAPPSASSSSDLVDLSHWDGVPADVQRKLLLMAYGRGGGTGALHADLDELGASLNDLQRLNHAAHKLYGVAQTAGAVKLAAEVQTFRAAPSAEGVATLRSLLGVTQQHLEASGMLSV